MPTLNNIRIEDDAGNVYYPHTKASVVFMEDGKNAETVISQLSNPNLLINGDFQIWQRATSFKAKQADQYTADRWMMIGSLDTLNKVDKVTNGLKITTGPSYILYFKQILEIPNMLGKTVTISCSVDGILYKLTATISTTNSALTTPWGVFYTQYSTVNNLLSCSFAINPSKTIIINWVKLELGEIATPLSPRPVGAEFTLCKRYTQKAPLMGIPYGILPNGIYFFIPLDNALRINPTLIQGDLTVLKDNVPISGFTFGNVAQLNNGIILLATKTNHGLSGNIGLYSNTAILDSEIY